MSIDLRLGDWRNALADVDEIDALITDPPYGARTHEGHNAAQTATGSRTLDYAHFTPLEVGAFGAHWFPRVRGWVFAMTSHDLFPSWEMTAQLHGLTTFAPVPIVYPDSVRMSGDGPASATVSGFVARTKKVSRWGSLPGFYMSRRSAVRGTGHIGGKAIGLMRQIVGHYTNPGWTVVDPCAGYGTTLLAAAELGCNAIGSEVDPDTHAKAAARIAKGYTPMPHPRASKTAGKPKQGALW